MTASLIVLWAGCGSGDSALTVADFCAQKATKECGAKGSGGVADHCFINAETMCKPKRIEVCLAWANKIAAESGAMRPFNPARAGDCLSKAGEVYRKSTIVPADRVTLDAICERVFSGSKKMGDVCVSDYECGGALICDGVCAPKLKQVKGDFCDRVPGSACGDGLYCAKPPGQPLEMCVDRKNAGESCLPQNDECLESLRCLSDSSTCGPRASFMDSCESDSDCIATSPYCDPFLGNKCAPGFTPAPNTPECASFGAPI